MESPSVNIVCIVVYSLATFHAVRSYLRVIFIRQHSYDNAAVINTMCTLIPIHTSLQHRYLYT